MNHNFPSKSQEELPTISPEEAELRTELARGFADASVGTVGMLTFADYTPDETIGLKTAMDARGDHLRVEDRGGQIPIGERRVGMGDDPIKLPNLSNNNEAVHFVDEADGDTVDIRY